MRGIATLDWPRVIGQERYGLAAGCDATFVALRAPNAVAVAAVAVAAVAAVAVAVAVAVAAAAAAAAADASVPAERRVVRRGESDAGAQFTPGLRFAR
ncbi:hypothetical protein WS63_19485 [Burkholderia stagnalis]|uniref:hypothetical protein n=1 Tax=Burkholderia stagnalis TaxID=1503054 RepID=UPI00075526BD|nr:hypothetical protein [Burkholderia stagnalis]KVD86880.1 hypothetical protein WS63_19485 [Burkholderia stagnalis]